MAQVSDNALVGVCVKIIVMLCWSCLTTEYTRGPAYLGLGPALFILTTFFSIVCSGSYTTESLKSVGAYSTRLTSTNRASRRALCAYLKQGEHVCFILEGHKSVTLLSPRSMTRYVNIEYLAMNAKWLKVCFQHLCSDIVTHITVYTKCVRFFAASPNIHGIKV